MVYEHDLNEELLDENNSSYIKIMGLLGSALGVKAVNIFNDSLPLSYEILEGIHPEYQAMGTQILAYSTGAVIGYLIGKPVGEDLLTPSKP